MGIFSPSLPHGFTWLWCFLQFLLSLLMVHFIRNYNYIIFLSKNNVKPNYSDYWKSVTMMDLVTTILSLEHTTQGYWRIYVVQFLRLICAGWCSAFVQEFLWVFEGRWCWEVKISQRSWTIQGICMAVLYSVSVVCVNYCTSLLSDFTLKVTGTFYLKMMIIIIWSQTFSIKLRVAAYNGLDFLS